MKLPEEFLLGSKQLDKERELLSLGLMRLAIDLFEKIYSTKEFQNLVLKKRGGFGFFRKSSDEEKGRIMFELSIFNLFAISRWFMNNFEDNPTEILDRTYYHFRKSMSDNDLEFGALVEQRYSAYQESLNNQSGAGPTYWFNKTAAQYVLGQEQIEAKLLFQSTLFFSERILLFVTNSVKEFVNSGKYKKLVSE